MNDVTRSIDGMSLGSNDVQKLKLENERLRAKIASLEGSGGAAVDISGGRAELEIPFEELELDQQIGGGGFSLVYRAMWRGTPVAVKRWFNPDLTEAVMQEFRAEVMTMQNLRHPHVAQMLGACMRPPNLCIVLEFLPHSLFYVLHESNIEVDRKRAIGLATDVCRVFNYLHARKVIHRDIKPANFLVDRAWKVKICDFGLASQAKNQLGAGTPAYMAPELFLAGEGKAYNEKVDVYAFGVMLNEMLGRLIPWSNTSVPEIKRAVLDGERPEIPLSCSRALSNLIKDCWHQEPARRPSFESIQEQLKNLA